MCSGVANALDGRWLVGPIVSFLSQYRDFACRDIFGTQRKRVIPSPIRVRSGLQVFEGIRLDVQKMLGGLLRVATPAYSLAGCGSGAVGVVRQICWPMLLSCGLLEWRSRAVLKVEA